jgi:threonine aldolase
MVAWRGFGSDNHAGAHPEVIAALAEVNVGHAHPYGEDPWTARALEAIRAHVGPDSQIELVWNGTGANVTCLAALCRPWESVICAESAHINTDECGAPEHIANVKLVSVPTPDGKLTPRLVEPQLTGFGFEHHAQPRVISISQASELGTIYTAEEVAALARLAHGHGMFLHVDGARISNAAAGLGCTIAEITSAAGVDALSFGGTKNGMIGGEAVVLFGEAMTDELAYVRKQSAQLSSKMRYVAAQFIAMFEGDLWLRCASHANAMAARLAQGAVAKGVRIAHPAIANEVFAELSDDVALDLADRFHFYVWQPGVSAGKSLVRWVTSWDTEAPDVDALLEALGG